MTGIEIERLPDGGFHLRQQKSVDHLELMSLSQRRSRAELRGVSGSANFFGNQTRADLRVSTSLLQVAHASATVADTREANKLIRLCRQHPIPLDDLTCVGFGDCGWVCAARWILTRW